jgi:hypothetical protein
MCANDRIVESLKTGRWIIIVLTFAIALPLYAQDWTVWLYDIDEGLLLHLNAEGKVLNTQSIPIDEGYAIPHRVVFSHNQTLMATVTQAEDSFYQRLTLYAVDSNDVIYTYDLPPVDTTPLNADDHLILSDDAFSQNDKQMAFVTFVAGVGWTIHIVDTATGDITYTLSFNDPQVTQQPYLKSFDIPQIAMFQDNVLGFYISNTENDSSLQAHSYAWFLIPNQVYETFAFPNTNHDILTTGEIIYPLPDKLFPSDNETIPVIRPHHNTVYVYQVESESRYPSITRPELDLLQTWFIQAGERILIEAWEDEIRTRWLIYDRNGQEIRNMPQAGIDVTATQDGFLYLTELSENTVLVHVNSRTFETAGDTIWVDEGNWQIVSITSALSNNLLPFAQIGNTEILPPLIISATHQPTPIPTPLSLVYIGREMQIQAFDDSYINLRDTPSTDGEVLALLENGLYVDILEGPVESEIYTWWKVGLSGREGWLVEEVEDTQVLIPRKPIEEESENKD